MTHATVPELVTSKDLRIEKKGIDQYMGRSFDSFVANTNVPDPMILPDNQRRFFVNEFSLVVAREMDLDVNFKERYLVRLAAVLADVKMWRALAYMLFLQVPTPEKAAECLASFHMRRKFNPYTTEIQLKSMMAYKDRSVLGFLWRYLEARHPFTTTQNAGDAFLLEDDGLVPAHWRRWAALRHESHPRAMQFEDHDWKKNEGEGWWHREERGRVYALYAGTMRKLFATVSPVDEIQFGEELQRILGFTDEHTRPAFKTVSEVRRRVVDNKPEGVAPFEWYYFAPLAELRKAVARALPSALNFSWPEWDARKRK